MKFSFNIFEKTYLFVRNDQFLICVLLLQESEPTPELLWGDVVVVGYVPQ